mgnify:CR=1 FL=1
MIAGVLFGIVGLIVAIPVYTVIKVILKEFLSDNQIAPNNGEYHSRMCNFVKTANFVAPVTDKKEEKKPMK